MFSTLEASSVLLPVEIHIMYSLSTILLNSTKPLEVIAFRRREGRSKNVLGSNYASTRYGIRKDIGARQMEKILE